MLREALQQGEFVITCEFVPGRGKDGAAVNAAVEFAKWVPSSGMKIHAVSLTDCPGGNPAISPDVLAREIQAAGLDVLVHFSCRDINRNAIEARAMALARNGIKNLLVITGDYTKGGFEGAASPVFDLDAVQAVKYLKAMSRGLDVPGRKKGTTDKLSSTDFCVAAAVSPFKLAENEYLPQLFKMEKKIAAGADFIITQLGYDMRKSFEVKRYLASRGLKTPVFGNVYVLSAGAAKAMRAGEVPGCVVPDSLMAVLEEEAKAPDKGKRKRLERAAKMVAAFKGMGFNGVHIGGFGLTAEDFKFILTHAAEIAPQWESFVPELCFSRKDEFYAFPPPASYKLTTPDPDPVAGLKPQSKPAAFAFWDFMHGLAFEEGKPLYKMIRAYYRGIGDKGVLAHLSHIGEFMAKRVFFECRDCGDCGLPELAYRCPMSKCAKRQRNGPCGGSKDGMCEVYPDEKPCVWTVVYQRLKSVGRLDEMRTGYVPARRTELEYTSGWANYFLGRDHTQKAPEPTAPEQKAG